MSIRHCRVWGLDICCVSRVGPRPRCLSPVSSSAVTRAVQAELKIGQEEGWWGAIIAVGAGDRPGYDQTTPRVTPSYKYRLQLSSS